MSFWQSIFNIDDGAEASTITPTVINPATGLAMIFGGYSGVDLGGSPYGVDASPFSDAGLFSDSWISGDF